MIITNRIRTSNFKPNLTQRLRMDQATEVYHNPAQILNLYLHFIQKSVLLPT